MPRSNLLRKFDCVEALDFVLVLFCCRLGHVNQLVEGEILGPNNGARMAEESWIQKAIRGDLIVSRCVR